LIPVTLIVTTRNEELNIEKCLQSAYSLVDQIFVIDSESNDETPAISRRYAQVVNLPYEHGKIIPWIYQWGLDNLPIKNDWVLILEADQSITPELKTELESLFAQGEIKEQGFYIKRQQVFRGKRLRFGGYGAKYMLKLFYRNVGKLDAEESDTRIYVDGKVGKLSAPILEENLKENAILFYLQKHLRYADVFAHEEALRRGNLSFKTTPAFFGTPDQRVLWLKRMYFRLPLYVRPFLYFTYRYFLLLGFLDGKQGTIFHFLQAFWFRLVLDIRLEEILKARRNDALDAEQDRTLEKSPSTDMGTIH
jgi:glycosyltransferase involved in cell wall biosynthesis